VKDEWQVTVQYVKDPEAVAAGRRLLVELALQQFASGKSVTTNLLCSSELVSSKKA
jgi:hypothetical protein